MSHSSATKRPLEAFLVRFLAGGVFPVVLIGNMACASPRQPTSTDPPSATLREFLVDENLWGTDYPRLLATISSWPEVDQPRIAVFPVMVVGSSPYLAEEDAALAADILTRLAHATQPLPQAYFRGLFADTVRLQAFRAGVVSYPEDSTLRIAWTGTSLEFLRQDTRIAYIRRRYGEPDSLTRTLVQSEKDHRPVVLIASHYFGGVVQVVQVNLAPVPGIVDRILFDVEAIRQAVFR